MNTLQWKPNVPDEQCDCEASGHNCYQGHTAEIADNATYVVDIRAYLEVRGPRGGEHRYGVGTYKTIEEAKLACERDYADGVEYAMQRPVAAA